MEKRIFLIDGEASERHSVSVGLSQKGYDTELCESGLKALKALEKYKQHQISPDCIVLDVRLPDIDGMKLLRVIKQNYPDIPVVMLSGTGQDTTPEFAHDDMADAYLIKPFSIDELSAILDGLPAHVQSKEELAQTPATVSAYALLKFKNKSDLMQTYNDLYFNENVLYCDATKGEYDLVLLLHGDTMNDIRAIAEKALTAKGVFAEVSLMPCEVPMFEESVNTIMQSVDKALGRDRGTSNVEGQRSFRSGASSYVFLQIEKEKFDAIYPTLYLNDHIVHCDYTKGKYDISLLVKGSSFADIDRTIKTHIKPIDGVLKLKECPIINFFEN